MPTLSARVKITGCDEKSIKILIETPNNHQNAEKLAEIANLAAVPVWVQIVNEQLTIEDVERERQEQAQLELTETQTAVCPVCGAPVDIGSDEELQCGVCGTFFQPKPWIIIWADADGNGGDLDGRYATKAEAEEQIDNLVKMDNTASIEYSVADFGTVPGAWVIDKVDEECRLICTVKVLFRHAARAQQRAEEMHKELDADYMTRLATKQELEDWAESIVEDEADDSFEGSNSPAAEETGDVAA